MAICGIIQVWRDYILKVSVSKSKNATLYYISKSIWKDGKSTTKTIERLGSAEEIRARAGDPNVDPLEWAKKYAAELTRKEKEGNREIIVKYSSNTLIDKDAQQSVNVGYLFLQDIYYDLGLDKICSTLSENYKFTFDLNAVLSRLVYSRVIYPASKLATMDLSKKFLEPPKFELQHIYRGLEFLAKESSFIQSQLYKNSLASINRKKGILYYDCTNYFFEIEEEDGFRKYGHSKEHRPNPIVQMGLFMDADGIPLCFSVFPGNQNEQPSMTPLEEMVVRDFDLKRFVVCTDAGLSSVANRKFNNIASRSFITTQSIKKLPGFLRDFCLGSDGWRLSGHDGCFNLSEVNKDEYYNRTFYKERWMNENGLEQHLIVTFSFKYRDYQRTIRDRQIERACAILEKPYKNHRHGANDCRRFIHEDYCTKEGEKAAHEMISLNEDRIREEERFDGFYAVCTNLEDDPMDIIAVNRHRWKIEECFRIIKSEFKARPVYLSREDRIQAHFMTCYIALIIYRLLEIKLKNKFTCEEIISTLRQMDMLSSPAEGYIPAYTRTDLTDALHDAFGFRTDYQITSKKNMKKICSQTKK